MRLYLTSAAHPDSTVFSGQAGGWANTMGNVKSLLSPTKQGTNTAYSLAETSATNPYNGMIRRWISQPFLRAGSFVPGTISYMFARMESAIAADMSLRVCVTIHGANGVARAVVGTWLNSTEWPTTLTAAGGTLSGGNTVEVVAGEYLSVEVGYVATNSSTTSYTGTIRGGGTNATDLVSGDTTNASVRPAWIDFPTTGLENLWTIDTSQGAAVRFDAELDGLQRTIGVPPATHTFSFWAKINVDRNAYSTFYEPTDGGTVNYMQVSTEADGITLGAHSEASNDPASSYVPTVGTWFFFAGVRTPTGTRILAGPTATSLQENLGDSYSTWSMTKLCVGWSDSWSGEWLNGDMAALKIWSAELTNEEIIEEAKSYRAKRSLNLLSENLMEGDTLTDYSGNGFPLANQSSGTARSSVPGPPGLAYLPAANPNPDQNNHLLNAA